MAGGSKKAGDARAAGATTLTQASENFGYSRMRLRRIAKLQFGIVNPVELVSNVLNQFIVNSILKFVIIDNSVSIVSRKQLLSMAAKSQRE
jgi:tripartite-type tricarboxylate transporter receptor subunit TctC